MKAVFVFFFADCINRSGSEHANKFGEISEDYYFSVRNSHTVEDKDKFKETGLYIRGGSTISANGYSFRNVQNVSFSTLDTEPSIVIYNSSFIEEEVNLIGNLFHSIRYMVEGLWNHVGNVCGSIISSNRTSHEISKLHRLFYNYLFKGYSIALVKPLLSLRTISMGFRIPFTANFPVSNVEIRL